MPAVHKPKLSRIQRNAINGGVEQAREWLAANEVAVRAQAHALLDRVLVPVGEWIGKAHPAVDAAVDWAKAKLAALKF